MENKAISTHIVVVNQNSAKPAESKASNTPDGGGAGFANVLAAQIQGDRPVSEVSIPPNLAEPLLDEQGQIATDAANNTSLEQAHSDPNAFISSLNLQSAAQLQNVKLEPRQGADSETLTLEVDLGGKGRANQGRLLALDKAANEASAAAKFAVNDKTLPQDTLREIKTDFSYSNTLTASSSLSPFNRVPVPVQPGSAVPTPLTTVAVPVGQTGWDAAFSQRVTWVATNAQQIAQLHLNPPNLGPLEIRINLSSEQTHASFVSPHAVVRDAIEAALPRLREMLADNGLSLGNVNVSSESFQQQQQAQSGQSDQQRHDPFRALQQIAGSASSAAAITAQGVVHIASAQNGLVDIFA